MADSKISALPASTTPLAGTEVLPIVQSSTTKQVSVANLTAGRAISATQLTLTIGNLIVANGQGIDFSATSGTGTSELFNDYEEGTWTPASGVGSASSVAGTYTKQGRAVFFTGTLTFPVQVDANVATITGLPFSASASSYGSAAIRYTNQGTAFTMFQTGTSINMFLLSGGGASYTAFSNIRVDFAGFYFV